MRKERFGTLVLLGVAGIAFAVPGLARDPGPPVKFDATVNNIREVPAGKPQAGLHIDARVNGQNTDIYLAPLDFAVRYGLRVTKGEYVRITGYSENGSQVVAREVTTGNYDSTHNIFRPTLTIYLRNDDGPFWVDTQKPTD